MSKDENSRFYFKKITKEELLPLFSRVVREGVLLQLWPKGDESKAEEFKVKGFNPETLEFRLERKSSLIQKLLTSSLAGKELLVKFSFDRYHYFSTTTLHFHQHELDYSVTLQQEFFLGQQRANYRLKSSVYNKIRIKIGETVFDCLDISSGGVSLRISKDFLTNFSQGSLIKDLKIQFDKELYTIYEAKVVISKPEGDLIFVALQFQNLLNETEERLTRHINSEARAEETRKKFLKTT